MKYLFLSLFALGLSFQAAAQQQPEILIQKGVREVRITGGLDLDSYAGTVLELNTSYGQYVFDYILVGGGLEIENSDFVKAYGLNIFGEWNYDSLTYWIPFVGARAGYRVFDAEFPNFVFDDSGAVVGPYAGVKYYFTRSLAWNAQLNVDWASGDLFTADDGATELDTKLTMGIRVHF